MIRVLLVDDQVMVRRGFQVLLEEHEDICIVGQAAGGWEAVQLVNKTQPDVVCMDLRMPKGDGIEATRQIVTARHGNKPAVLVVTTFDLDQDVFGALEAGADGFILKDCEPEELVSAVHCLAHGHGLIDQAVTRRVLNEFARRYAPQQPPILSEELTRRESEILRLVATGMSNAEIAEMLFVEISTVKSHITRLLPKIGARDRVQAVVWAFRHGLAR